MPIYTFLKFFYAFFIYLASETLCPVTSDYESSSFFIGPLDRTSSRYTESAASELRYAILERRRFYRFLPPFPPPDFSRLRERGPAAFRCEFDGGIGRGGSGSLRSSCTFSTEAQFRLARQIARKRIAIQLPDCRDIGRPRTRRPDTFHK